MFLYEDQAYATGFVNPKTTLLFFDRLWLPAEIAEERIHTNTNWQRRLFLATDYGAHAYIGAEHNNAGHTYIKSESQDDMNFYTTHHRNFTIKQYAESIKNRFNIDVTAIYHKPTQFEQDYKIDTRAPDFNSIQFCFDNVPEIDEELLDWNQVNDFRLDIEEIQKLRHFKLWVASDLSRKTENEIKSTFEKALDDYKFALKKHGVLTSLGAFSTLITTSAALLQCIEQGVFNQVIAGVSIAASLVYTVSEACAIKKEMNRNPIAYIYDISKKLGS